MSSSPGMTMGASVAVVVLILVPILAAASSATTTPITETATAAGRPRPLVVESVIQLEGGTASTSAGRYTNVIVGSDGLPLVVYNAHHRFDEPRPPPPDAGDELAREGGDDYDGGVVRARHCLDVLCTDHVAHDLSKRSHSRHRGGYGRFISLSQSSGPGLPLAAWSAPYIHVSSCSTPSCSSSETKVLAHVEGRYPSIAIGVDGTPRIAFYVEGTGGVRLVTCSDARCLDPPSSVVDMVTGPTVRQGVGLYPSLSTCAGGVPCVAYHDANKGELLFARCYRPDCLDQPPAAEPAVLDGPDGTGNLGTFVSMKVGRDGMPVMMYADEATGAIKVVHCGDVYCRKNSGGGGGDDGDSGNTNNGNENNKGNTVTTVDHVGVGVYGLFPELDISPLTGYPVLSYFNQTNSTSGALRITQCSDCACADKGRRVSQTVLTGRCGLGRDSSLAFGRVGAGRGRAGDGVGMAAADGRRAAAEGAAGANADADADADDDEEATYVYVSFLDYNGDGVGKRASLAVLRPSSSSFSDDDGGDHVSPVGDGIGGGGAAGGLSPPPMHRIQLPIRVGGLRGGGGGGGGDVGEGEGDAPPLGDQNDICTS